GEIGFPPLLINGKPIKGGKALLDVSHSSQYASALMLIAPMLQKGLEVKFTGKRVSMPYLQMTASLMRMAGIPVSMDNNGFNIPYSSFLNTRIDGEKDWSSAAFWYEALALAQRGEIFFPGLKISDIQGDRFCMDLFCKLGINTVVKPEGVLICKEGRPKETVDEVLTDYPDLVLPFFSAMAGLQVPGRIQGITHLHYKESDRLQTLSEELIRAGFNIFITEDALILNKGRVNQDKYILDAHDDHRIFMGLLPLCQVLGKIRVSGASSVKKSYPDFISQIRDLGFTVDISGE
ncbi:MAG: hypothetical protein KKA81_14765, partial [Bacteroidetes bacterium]|nr:hypothetical protein [Bacteroidota bacterium]